MMRAITIEIAPETYEMPFDSEKVKDSEALHVLLSFVDPGDDYSVRFFNLPEDWTPTDNTVHYM